VPDVAYSALVLACRSSILVRARSAFSLSNDCMGVTDALRAGNVIGFGATDTLFVLSLITARTGDTDGRAVPTSS
jgi:hypothetical protein